MPGRVDQRRADAERARLHLVRGPARASVQLRGRGARLSRPDHVLADRGGADEGGHVRRDALLLQVARYSASVVHVIVELRSPCSSLRPALHLGVRGPIDEPSPMICVVTPCRISPCERPSTSSESVDHDNMLMKPGETASPVASTRRVPRAADEVADRGDPVAAEPTSARRGRRPCRRRPCRRGSRRRTRAARRLPRPTSRSPGGAGGFGVAGLAGGAWWLYLAHSERLAPQREQDPHTGPGSSRSKRSAVPSGRPSRRARASRPTARRAGGRGGRSAGRRTRRGRKPRPARRAVSPPPSRTTRRGAPRSSRARPRRRARSPA